MLRWFSLLHDFEYTLLHLGYVCFFAALPCCSSCWSLMLLPLSFLSFFLLFLQICVRTIAVISFTLNALQRQQRWRRQQQQSFVTIILHSVELHHLLAFGFLYIVFDCRYVCVHPTNICRQILRNTKFRCSHYSPPISICWDFWAGYFELQMGIYGRKNKKIFKIRFITH